MDTCSVEGCEKPREARGWCRMHYGRWYRWGDPLEADHRKNRSKSRCSEDGCEREHYAKGLCARHYAAQRRPGPGASYMCDWCGVRFEAQKRRTTNRTFCTRACKQHFYNAQPEKKTALLRSYYLRRYSLTLDEVATMRANGCGICGRFDAPGRWEGNLHIDHDHESGDVRGALCHSCNVALGHFQHDPALLQRAIEYLS